MVLTSHTQLIAVLLAKPNVQTTWQTAEGFTRYFTLAEAVVKKLYGRSLDLTTYSFGNPNVQPAWLEGWM